MPGGDGNRKLTSQTCKIKYQKIKLSLMGNFYIIKLEELKKIEPKAKNKMPNLKTRMIYYLKKQPR